MIHSDTLLTIDLALFDGGAGAAPSAAGEGGADGATQGESQALPGTTRRGKSGAYQNVVFGKQESAAAAADQPAGDGKDGPADAGQEKGAEVITTSDTLEERRRAYREMVEGEYKDLYTEDTQRIIDRRFRETKQLERQAAKQQGVIDLLMQRYQIPDGDLSKLTAAIENDDAYWSEAAEEAGMTVDQYKRLQKLQRENAELLRERRMHQGQQAAQQQLRKWYSESEQVKSLYPSFDLSAEVKNPEFLSMLRAGVPVQHAYEVIHMAQIKAGVAQMTAKATEKQVVAGIRAKGARPAENGTAAQSAAFTVKDDPSKWTRKDRAEVARRVARGETITL